MYYLHIYLTADEVPEWNDNMRRSAPCPGRGPLLYKYTECRQLAPGTTSLNTTQFDEQRDEVEGRWLDREWSGQIFIFWWCDVHILCFVFPLLTKYPLTEHQPQTSGQQEAGDGAELARKCQNRNYGHDLNLWLIFWQSSMFKYLTAKSQLILKPECNRHLFLLLLSLLRSNAISSTTTSASSSSDSE